MGGPISYWRSPISYKRSEIISDTSYIISEVQYHIGPLLCTCTSHLYILHYSKPSRSDGFSAAITHQCSSTNPCENITCKKKSSVHTEVFIGICCFEGQKLFSCLRPLACFRWWTVVVKDFFHPSIHQEAFDRWIPGSLWCCLLNDVSSKNYSLCCFGLVL